MIRAPFTNSTSPSELHAIPIRVRCSKPVKDFIMLYTSKFNSYYWTTKSLEKACISEFFSNTVFTQEKALVNCWQFLILYNFMHSKWFLLSVACADLHYFHDVLINQFTYIYTTIARRRDRQKIDFAEISNSHCVSCYSWIRCFDNSLCCVSLSIMFQLSMCSSHSRLSNICKNVCKTNQQQHNFQDSHENGSCRAIHLGLVFRNKEIIVIVSNFGACFGDVKSRYARLQLLFIHEYIPLHRGGKRKMLAMEQNVA